MTDLVDVLREYGRSGAKFRHRGRSPTHGDCAGAIKLAYAHFGIHLPDLKHYGREPANDGLVEMATAALGPPVHVAPVRLSDLRRNDVVLLKFAVRPHHVMLVGTTPYSGGLPTGLHMDSHYGKVIEHRLDEKLAADITHVFRRPV